MVGASFEGTFPELNVPLLSVIVWQQMFKRTGMALREVPNVIVNVGCVR